MKFEGFGFKKRNRKEKNNNNKKKQKKEPRDSLYSCCFKFEVGTIEVLVLEGVEQNNTRHKDHWKYHSMNRIDDITFPQQS